MFDFDLEWFADTTAWVVTIVLYFLFMYFIWASPFMDASQWEPYNNYRIIITVLGPVVMYVVAKMMIEKG